MNTEILNKVKEIILKEPNKLEMLVWKFASQRCIGGFVLDITPSLTKASLGLPVEDVWGLELETCAKILDISIEQANKLFPLAGWTKPFRDLYHAAEDAKGRAQVVANRIDYFITNEH